MAGAVTFETDFDSNDVFDGLLRSVAVSVKRAGEQALGDIVARTLSGQSSTGAMPGYSSGYKRVREERGLQVGHVDMNFTGRMMQSLQTTVFQEGTSVGFEIAPTPDQGAKVAYTTNYPGRDWFALSESEKESAITTIMEG